ncbi:hypothetical protein HDE_01155 [Halotydeus destructor]|nr:hypothetical protein HDE_01155 [Halotydeus destructor]
MNSATCIVFALLGAILLKTSCAGDPCSPGMTEAKWLKCGECAKQYDPDFKVKSEKWVSCFSQVASIPIDKVPTKFDDIKAIACTDANKAKKDKFKECMFGGSRPQMSADMKVSQGVAILRNEHDVIFVHRNASELFEMNQLFGETDVSFDQPTPRLDDNYEEPQA